MLGNLHQSEHIYKTKVEVGFGKILELIFQTMSFKQKLNTKNILVISIINDAKIFGASF